MSITQNHSHTNILLTECSSGFLHFLLFVICLEPLWVVSFRAEKGLIQLNWLNLYFRKKIETLNLIFSFLLGIGLLYVNASVWQMLRGSIIIFTGVLSVSMVQFTF